MITVETTSRRSVPLQTIGNAFVCTTGPIARELQSDISTSKSSSRRRRASRSFLAPFPLDICEYRPTELVSSVSRETPAAGTFDQSVNGWLAFVREKFYSVSGVESIFVAVDDRDVDVWLIIPDRDFELLRAVVVLEMEVARVLSPNDKSLFLFEFHVLYRCGFDERELVPKGAMRLSRGPRQSGHADA